MFSLTDKVVVITGAAGALGRVVAHAFHKEGARLAAIDRERSMVSEVFASRIPEGDYCRMYGANLLDESSVSETAKQIVADFGRVDALINIAGGYAAGAPVHETEERTWEFMFNLNARTVFYTCRSLVPQMIEQGGGRIVNISAGAAARGRPGMGAYVASKSAVLRLTESMAIELRDDNINVNALMPGAMDTEANRKQNPDADFSRWVSPAAVADVILFLCSEAGRAVTGVSLPVHGRGVK